MRFRFAATLVAVLLAAAAVYTVRKLGLGVQDTGCAAASRSRQRVPLVGAAR